MTLNLFHFFHNKWNPLNLFTIRQHPSNWPPKLFKNNGSHVNFEILAMVLQIPIPQLTIPTNHTNITAINLTIMNQNLNIMNQNLNIMNQNLNIMNQITNLYPNIMNQGIIQSPNTIHIIIRWTFFCFVLYYFYLVLVLIFKW